MLSAYTDVDKLEITTLENAIYMNYKNDGSMRRSCLFQKRHEDGHREGLEEGHREGEKAGLKAGEQRLAQLLQSLIEAGRSEEISRVLSDSAYREQLYREENL